jgi:hypothetical protein
MILILYGSVAISGILLIYAMYNLVTHKARTDAAINHSVQASIPSVENRYRIS